MDHTMTALHLTASYNNSSTATPTMITEFTTEGILKASAVAVLIIVAIVGNLLVCISFITFRNLHSLTNYFIVSLSIADLLVAFVTMPMWLGVQLHIPRRWPPLQSPLRLYLQAMDQLVCLASVLSLTAISVERNLAITNPFCYTKWLSPKRVLIAIAGLWVYAITITVVTMMNPFPEGTSLALFILFSTYVLPLLILFTMYTRIFIVARRQTRRLRQDGAFATDMKAVKTIAIVVGAYIVCYTPFFVVLIWAHFHISPLALHTISIARWLTYLNSCLNPIIYSCFNKTYRKSFKRLFKDWGKSIQEFRIKVGAKKPTISSSRSSFQRSHMSLNVTMQGSAGSLLDGPKTSIDMISLDARSRGSPQSTQATQASAIDLNGQRLIVKGCCIPQETLRNTADEQVIPKENNN